MDELTKKESYQEKRREKSAKRAQEEKQKKQKTRFTFIAIAAPLIVIFSLLFFLVGRGSSSKIPDIGQLFPIQGRDHIAEGAPHPPYNSNPPTSGWHYATPSDWGVHKDEISQERLVHNLEHGGIVIQYKPDTLKDIIQKLESLKDSNFACKLVVAPYAKLDKNIALSAWGRLYKSNAYDETTIKNFIRKYYDRAPEAPSCDQKAAPMSPSV